MFFPLARKVCYANFAPCKELLRNSLRSQKFSKKISAHSEENKVSLLLRKNIDFSSSVESVTFHIFRILLCKILNAEVAQPGTARAWSSLFLFKRRKEKCLAKKKREDGLHSNPSLKNNLSTIQLARDALHLGSSKALFFFL